MRKPVVLLIVRLHRIILLIFLHLVFIQTTVLSVGLFSMTWSQLLNSSIVKVSKLR